MHPLVKLAKDTVEQYVKHGGIISPPDELSPEMCRQAGTFVSLKIRGELRGCIGTFQPTTDNVADEIIQNAISASTKDPRFPPVTEEELAVLEYSVDILSAPEQVESAESLDPRKYGIIVKSGMRKGLLLPDLQGVDTVEDQINIACMKAGISRSEEIELFRFEVRRYR